MYNNMMSFGGMGMTGFGGYNALGMTGYGGYGYNPVMGAMNPLAMTGMAQMGGMNALNATGSGMLPQQPGASPSPQSHSPTPQQQQPQQISLPQSIQRPPHSVPGRANATTQRNSGTIALPGQVIAPPPARATPGAPTAVAVPPPAEPAPAAPSGMAPPPMEPEVDTRQQSTPVTLGSLQCEDDGTQGAVGFSVVSSSSSASSGAASPTPGTGGSLLPDSHRVEWGNMPFEVLPGTELGFELGSRQAPVDEELHQMITLRNSSGSKQSFCFEPIPSGKYTLSAEPSEGKIPSGKEQNILIKMTVQCTTEFKLELPLIAWKGDMKDAEKAKRSYAMLTAEIESQLTTKLDSDELTLYSPPVGEGSFGTIYRGDYRGADVAVKVLKYQNTITPDMINDFKSEIGIMEKLRHPCIINFIGAVHTPGKFAIVTEFCPFGNLGGVIKKESFGYVHKLKALVDTAKGMNFLHRSNIMHRDLKPDNILMVSLEYRSSVICKISDFGTTRDVNRFSHEMSFTKGVGTPIFMAPELLSGRRDYEKSADVYSFGMMMVNLITLKQPFEGDPNITSPFQFANYVIEGGRPSLKGVKIQDDYKTLMEECWSTTPAKRPPFDVIVKRLEAMFRVATANMK